jgi:hypothetical protein
MSDRLSAATENNTYMALDKERGAKRSGNKRQNSDFGFFELYVW